MCLDMIQSIYLYLDHIKSLISVHLTVDQHQKEMQSYVDNNEFYISTINQHLEQVQSNLDINQF